MSENFIVDAHNTYLLRKIKNKRDSLIINLMGEFRWQVWQPSKGWFGMVPTPSSMSCGWSAPQRMRARVNPLAAVAGCVGPTGRGDRHATLSSEERRLYRLLLMKLSLTSLPSLKVWCFQFSFKLFQNLCSDMFYVHSCMYFIISDKIISFVIVYKDRKTKASCTSINRVISQNSKVKYFFQGFSCQLARLHQKYAQYIYETLWNKVAYMWEKSIKFEEISERHWLNDWELVIKIDLLDDL